MRNRKDLRALVSTCVIFVLSCLLLIYASLRRGSAIDIDVIGRENDIERIKFPHPGSETSISHTTTALPTTKTVEGGTRLTEKKKKKRIILMTIARFVTGSYVRVYAIYVINPTNAGRGT